MGVSSLGRTAALLLERCLVAALFVAAVATFVFVYVGVAWITRELAAALYVLLGTAVRERNVSVGGWAVSYLLLEVAVSDGSFAVAADELVTVLIAASLFGAAVGVFFAVLSDGVHL